MLLLAGVLFWVLSWTASKDLPAVADEIAHITGGESYWRYGVNHLQPENGYLAMHWATLPLRFRPPTFPAVPKDLPQTSAMIVIGHRMFYEVGNDPAEMLARGRAMMAIVGAAFVILIGWWGCQVWGTAGGALAAWCAAFCPNLLAHAGIVMSDIMLSFFLLLTVTCWWKLLHRVSPAGIVVSGLALAALLLSKMSGVIVAPMLVLLAAWRAVEPRPLAWSLGGPRVPVIGGQKLALIAVAGLLTSLIAGAALWAAFGFHFSMLANAAAPRPQFDVTWEQLLAKGGALQQTIACLRDHQLLPEAWLRGLAHTTFTLSGRYTFLNGDTMLGGTPWYFPYACLVKTPLPLFALMALGLAARFRKAHSARLSDTAEPAYPARAGFEACAPLIVLFFVYWAFALTTTINIGHRHMLPIYGPMLILAGGAAEFLFAGPMVRRGIVAALMAWLIASSLWIRPQYLAYFNAIAGGPANGYRHLVDSNVDVGQDLVRLRAWLETSASATAKQPPVFLSYFGPADPVSHGIRATRFGDNGFDARPRTFPARVGGGVYCMSVTLFQGLYTLTPGPWTRERETLYRRLLDIATSGRPTPDQATMLEHLQFARMRLGLAMREPDTRIGYSILVFRLSDDEAAQILYAPWEQRR